MPDVRDVMTVRAAADMVGVTRTMIKRLCDDPLSGVRAHVVQGGTIVVERAGIERYHQERQARKAARKGRTHEAA